MKEGVGTFEKKLAQQSTHPKQKAATTVKHILWTITLDAAWHYSEDPTPEFLCTVIKEKQVKAIGIDHP